MGVLKIKANGQWVEIGPGPEGPAGPAGPAGADGASEVPVQNDEPVGETGQLWFDRDAVPSTGTFESAWRDAWDSATAYLTGDLVGHEGSTWLATADSTNAAPGGELAPWDLVAAKGDQGPAGADGADGPAGADGAAGANGAAGKDASFISTFKYDWSPVTPYAKGDVVTHDGTSWLANIPNTNDTPTIPPPGPEQVTYLDFNDGVADEIYPLPDGWAVTSGNGGGSRLRARSGGRAQIEVDYVNNRASSGGLQRWNITGDRSVTFTTINSPQYYESFLYIYPVLIDDNNYFWFNHGNWRQVVAGVVTTGTITGMSGSSGTMRVGAGYVWSVQVVDGVATFEITGGGITDTFVAPNPIDQALLDAPSRAGHFENYTNPLWILDDFSVVQTNPTLPTWSPIALGGAAGAAGANGADGADGAAHVRETVQVTTGTLNASSGESLSIPMAPGYRILKIQTSSPSRVRLYDTAAHRDADTGRAAGADPTGDHGLMLEYFSTAGALSGTMSPVVDGFVETGSSAFARIGNRDTVARAITVTLTYVRTE